MSIGKAGISKAGGKEDYHPSGIGHNLSEIRSRKAIVIERGAQARAPAAGSQAPRSPDGPGVRPERLLFRLRPIALRGPPTVSLYFSSSFFSFCSAFVFWGFNSSDFL
jgi:hypothetical protein